MTTNKDFKPVIKALHDQGYLLEEQREETVLEKIVYGILALACFFTALKLFFSM